MIRAWYILGAGAIGRLMACKLQRMGLQPTLICRAGPEGPRRQRLRQGERSQDLMLRFCTIGSLPAASVAGLLVTTKAAQAAAAVGAVHHALEDGAPVVLLHNGMGVLEQLGAALPELNLLAGTTTEGAYLDGDLLVHAGHGATVIGQDGQGPPAWFPVFADSSERFRWEADIDVLLWHKLLINCAINPLTAIHRCRNGELLTRPELNTELRGICAELAAVHAARCASPDSAKIEDAVAAVIEATAHNRSSMLRDVELGRPTEIEQITGYLLAQAGRLGVPCPRNEQLLRRVRELDAARPSN